MRIFTLAALAALAFAQNERRMRADLDYLCSPQLEGRLSLSPSADKAAEYIAAEFKKAGLLPVDGKFLHDFPVVAYEPDRDATRLAILRKSARTELQSVSDFRGGYWQPVSATAAVIFAGYGITAPEYGYDDYAGIDARGKIVLAFDHEPQETDSRSTFNGTGHTRYAAARVKLENARRHGALALLLANEPLRKHPGSFEASAPRVISSQSLRAGAPRQALEEESIPLFQLSDSATAQLLQASGRTPEEIARAIDRDLRPASMLLADTQIELRTAPANLRRGPSRNVMGLLEGSDPALRGETVLLTAHYDHLGLQRGRVYAGANDNASGTAGVMELARWFGGEKTRPRRSLLFAVFGSEEEGLLGSYYYVAHPARPLATTRAVLNLDMIARDEAHIPQSQGVLEIRPDTRNEINLVGVFYNPGLLASIQKANAATKFEISTKFDRDHDLNALWRCDHFPFLLHDVPAVWIFGGWHPGYHEPSDTVDQLNFSKLDKVVRLTYEAAKAIADKP